MKTKKIQSFFLALILFIYSCHINIGLSPLKVYADTVLLQQNFNQSTIPIGWESKYITYTSTPMPQWKMATFGYEGSHSVYFNSYESKTDNSARLQTTLQ